MIECLGSASTRREGFRTYAAYFRIDIGLGPGEAFARGKKEGDRYSVLLNTGDARGRPRAPRPTPRIRMPLIRYLEFDRLFRPGNLGFAHSVT